MSGFTNLSAVYATPQFVDGTRASWDAVVVPIPKGLVIHVTDTNVVKISDGVTLYSKLPVLFILSQITSLQQEVTNVQTTQWNDEGRSGNVSTFSTTAVLRDTNAKTVNNQLWVKTQLVEYSR